MDAIASGAKREAEIVLYIMKSTEAISDAGSSENPKASDAVEAPRSAVTVAATKDLVACGTPGLQTKALALGIAAGNEKAAFAAFAAAGAVGVPGVPTKFEWPAPAPAATMPLAPLTPPTEAAAAALTEKPAAAGTVARQHRCILCL